MRIAVDISLYPFDRDYVPPIKDFIGRLNRRPGLAVTTHSMSTQVSGELDAVFDALRDEIAASFAESRRSVFVLKLFGGDD